MECEEYWRRSRLFRRLRSGPHGQLVERYAARLVGDGLVRHGTWRCFSSRSACGRRRMGSGGRVPTEWVFEDEGYGGASPVRPGSSGYAILRQKVRLGQSDCHFGVHPAFIRGRKPY
jgi:hypothetical protein